MRSKEAAKNKNNLTIKNDEKNYSFLSAVAIGNKLRHHRRYQKNKRNQTKRTRVLHGQRSTRRIRCNVVQ
jgi:hypothetical protein